MILIYSFYMVLKRTAVITGGSEGIGLATAFAFMQEGCRVAICARNQKRLRAAKERLARTGDVLAVRCDVGKSGEVKKFISTVKENFGKIDFLINNAGVLLVKEFARTSEEEWNSVLDTNLNGIFLVTKHALPIMQKNGVIVNVSSGAGKRGFAHLTAYCASKFAVIGLTESLADELKDRIKVYAVCPGGVNTKMYHSAWPGTNPHSLLQPEHIAAKILQLCLKQKARSGSAIEIYNIRDAVEYVKERWL
ncbi:MAG: SDR family oxidoreductase [Candidatus Aenigmarchaeota archaeon]|nr:SDR family oxidoreductase [Candidatus Aenigmarchaeota archaeon]